MESGGREPGEGRTCYLAAVVPVGVVYLFILRLVRRAHVPVESVLQPERLIFVLYPLELLLTAAQCAVRLGQVRFGFRDKPVWQYRRYLSVFLTEPVVSDIILPDLVGVVIVLICPAGVYSFPFHRYNSRYSSTYPIDQIKD